MCKRGFLGVRFIGLGNSLPGGTVKATLLEALKTRAGSALEVCEKKLFCSGSEQGLLQLWFFLLLCVQAKSGVTVGDVGLSIQIIHLHQTRWTKEIKMDLGFQLDRRATSMSPHLWQGVLSTSFKSRGERKRWDGILPTTKEITSNKISEMKGHNQRKFSLCMLIGVVLQSLLNCT